MKVDELKKLIRECVIQSVQELKEQFDHIQAKASLNKGKAKDGGDSGDKKMGPEAGTPPNTVKNANPKDQKGAMNEDVMKKDAPVLPEKKQEKKDQKKIEQTKKRDKKEDMKETKKEQKKQKVDECLNPAIKNANPGEQKGAMKEDVEVEIPLPRGVENAEASVEVVPNEDGQGSVAELIIVDDQVTPESIDEQMIEIEVPGQEGMEGGEGREQLPGQGREGLDMPPEGEGAPAVEPPPAEQPAPEGQDEFDRFEDLAGLKK